jgi:hypothetical protein
MGLSGDGLEQQRRRGRRVYAETAQIQTEEAFAALSSARDINAVRRRV